ncbi:hypothetical protein GCM10025783_05760 [Amnibacterium soli]|uniref:Nucleotide modification associated domain-containing protein n=1 Tax=Amnibacterium soli TaxID=1282736 RepID=A0ABP8YRZ3_9MICO
MTLYSYVVRYDIGFAPNPFRGLCSVATCKPVIRAHAAIGDWVLGVGSAEHDLRGRLVYAMRVEETVSYDQYWSDSRFRDRRPSLGGSRMQAFGDNIYHRDPVTGAWVQENGRHSLPDGRPNTDHIERDTRSDRVLLSQEFVYFGGDGPVIPAGLRSGDRDFLKNPRGHAVVRDPAHIDAIVEWVQTLGSGRLGRPADWPSLERPDRRVSERWQP